MRSSAEGKDLHILIGERNSKQGEHVHLIQDFETGEVRIDRDDKSPDELVERVVSVTTKSGGVISHKQKGVKTTLEFLDNSDLEENIPIVYTNSDVSPSGGWPGGFLLLNPPKSPWFPPPGQQHHLF